ncbi:inner membrane protein YhjD [Klebsiella pneumoniae]|nr:inner membrane protein YhjD [Klebsiella pneumoniae]
MQQRTAVGLVGLLVALYSGINWMGNLREAIRAQSRDVWERRPQDEEKIWVKYFRDLISLIGLLVALIITPVDHLRRRLRPADDYLRAVSRQH